MLWEVTGANRQTGEEQTLHIEAETEDSAIRRGNRSGLLVSTARPLDPEDSNAGVPAAASSIPAAPAPDAESAMEEIAAATVTRPTSRKPKKKNSPVALFVTVVVTIVIVVALLIINANKNAASSDSNADPANAAGNTPGDTAGQSAKPISTGTPRALRGSIGLVRDGTPDKPAMQPGITVYLIPTELPASVIAPTLLQSSADWEASAVTARLHLADAIAADERDQQSNTPTGEFAEAVKRDRATLADEESARDQAKAAAGMVLTMNPLDAYTLLKMKAYGLPNFAMTAAKTAVAKSQTDANGKFEIRGIYPGAYFVFASVHAGTTQTDWLFRVVFDGKIDQKVDLLESNALSNHDKAR